jgi:ribosomal protein S18 acetylase RimI-like enzyme
VRSIDLRLSAAGVRIVAWDGPQLAARINDAMAIYAEAMNYPRSAATQRAVTAVRHTAYPGFRCRVALEDETELVGFGYGYTTTPGQWWHDLVRRAIGGAVATEWLVDAFELSEIHVLPKYQGLGIGRRLLASLAHELPHRAMVLSTPDSDTRAFRLYRSLGFVDLTRNYLFPGDVRPFAVLGARLPFPAPKAATEAEARNPRRTT